MERGLLRRKACPPRPLYYGHRSLYRPRMEPAQPMGARAVYAFAMALTGTNSPRLPYSWVDPNLQGPETTVPPDTLLATRLAAILCAAAGLALICWRLGFRGLLATTLLLFIPHAREDLARAWAEGPLLLGLGLCIAAYGGRYFPLMCGLAATFKLTVLVAWPLAIYRGTNGGVRPTVGLFAAWGLWTALTPPSWFLGGPAYLPVMLAYRIVENRAQAQTYGNVAGLFVETRYLWPLELGALLLLTLLLSRVIHRQLPVA